TELKRSRSIQPFLGRSKRQCLGRLAEALKSERFRTTSSLQWPQVHTPRHLDLIFTPYANQPESVNASRLARFGASMLQVQSVIAGCWNAKDDDSGAWPHTRLISREQAKIHVKIE